LVASISLTLLFLLFAIWRGRKFHDHFENSLNNLLGATTAVASGNLDHSAPIIANDEFGRLTFAFNGMTRVLRETTVSKDALMRANKELEAFSYSVSHDLRSPLRSVDGFSMALLEDCSDKLDETGKRYIERIRNAIQKMGRLIDDMLDLSRLSRADLNITKVDLSECARAIAKDLTEENPNRAVSFKIQDHVEANADPALIKVVLQNLLSNSWKYTSKHPKALIEFGKTTVNGQSAFFVRDDGAGFDMAHMQKLFGPFQRLHKETEFPGTGVGLATVQRIITRHKGTIWAEAAMEHGASFYFTL
jgi:light-regulated signal transduction histidine kinase (bacteriophytochrome)